MSTLPLSQNETEIKNKLWLILWCLFGVSLFTSKSGISLFGTILLIWSFTKFNWRGGLSRNPRFLIMLSFFPLAVLTSFLSVGGVGASLEVVKGWHWPLYIVPISLLLKEEKTFHFFNWAAALGLFLACFKALTVFSERFGWHFDVTVRVDSFWDICRWAYYLACAIVFLFGLISDKSFNQRKSGEQIVLFCLFLIAFIFLTLANSRGPYLATLIGVGLLGITSFRSFKFFSAFMVLVLISLFFTPGVKERFRSSFDAKKVQGVYTSKDASNAGRLHMWQVNSELFKENLFFGTGFQSAEPVMREFLSKQSAEYIKTYVDPEFSFKDQHNSYLYVLVQMGLLFFIYFWTPIIFIMLKSVPQFFKTEDLSFKISFAVLAVNFFVFIFYSSVSSYEMLIFTAGLYVLGVRSEDNFSQCLIKDKFAFKKKSSGEN